MKLAEALILRADLQKRVEQIKSRLISYAKVQEGEIPAENPQDLLDELEKVRQQLTELIKRINRTNGTVKFNDTDTISDILTEREQIWNKRMILSHLTEAAMIKHDRYSRSELRYLSTVNVKDLQKQVDELSRQYRELDTRIQEKNWTIDLMQ
ncbi:DIP1984 family protein [Phosphitispora fastidiosa]|uniref:DIP1984 family protein n=1 Tax=Phosphitispora fastidiosa TaxID=2837202 RepID=UPI001E2ADB36|nr:methyl-accepting chemotaxis protein [Phosphitispora fastidiosa]